VKKMKPLMNWLDYWERSYFEGFLEFLVEVDQHDKD
jgi:hypothetical protein